MAGRPKGSFQKRIFMDTHVGRYIYLHEPLLYYIICPNKKTEPDVSLIELIIGQSSNPSFKSKRYRKYLDDYKENGLRVSRKKPITKEVADYYNDLRFRRALKYVRDHKEKLDIERKESAQIINNFIDKN